MFTCIDRPPQTAKALLAWPSRRSTRGTGLKAVVVPRITDPMRASLTEEAIGRVIRGSTSYSFFAPWQRGAIGRCVKDPKQNHGDPGHTEALCGGDADEGCGTLPANRSPKNAQ